MARQRISPTRHVLVLQNREGVLLESPMGQCKYCIAAHNHLLGVKTDDPMMNIV